MSGRQGPPKHQNKFAWKPNAGRKINETEPGGKFRPLSEITGVCSRCKEQIDWKRRYGKYKPLVEPAKCQKCSKRNVRQAYHNLCFGCAKEHNVCAKCCSRVDCTVGRDASEVEAEQKMLEEAIKHARERERRTLLRVMNKDKPKSSTKTTTNKETVGDLFPNASLEDYAKSSRNTHLVHNNHKDVDDEDGEDENEDHDDDKDDGEEGDENENDEHDYEHYDDGEGENDDNGDHEDSVHEHDDNEDGCEDRDKTIA